MTPTWHQPPSQLDLTAILNQLHVSGERGLSSHQVIELQKASQPNELPTQKPLNFLWLYLKQFQSPLIYLLFGAAVVNWLVGQTSDTWVILLVVGINSLIGFVQEARAEQRVRSLRQLLTPTTKVLRDGTLHVIPAKELVLGDIVHLEPGDRVPADARLMASYNLQCNEAHLTGESLPSRKSTQKLAHKALISDQHNMVWMGALVTQGQGQAIVTATGLDTELGRISNLIETAHELSSPLATTIRQFSRTLMLLVLVAVGIVGVIGWWRELPSTVLVTTIVSLVVSIIPEGLPVVVTVTLSLGLWRMAKQRSVIRKLDTLETLGSVEVICTDKTGTLTRGEMMVSRILAPGQTWTVTGDGFVPEGTILDNQQVVHLTEQPFLEDILRAAALSTQAQIEQSSNGQYLPIGDPTEVAFTVLAAKMKIFSRDLHTTLRLVFIAPFDQNRRWGSLVYKRSDGKYLSVTKGSPESLAQHSPRREWIIAKTKHSARAGNRVIALGWSVTSSDPTKQLSDGQLPPLDNTALLILNDPLRSDTFTAIQTCQTSGIQVIMVTGDHPDTAKEIGRQLNLPTEPLLMSSQLSELPPDEQSLKLAQASIIARATPEIKLNLVHLLQSQSKVIAMTGDGVNDAPALKQADVGVAMGRSGSDVAKEASDMVITDDRFATLVTAIQEGRLVWSNLRKVLFYLLSTSVGELLVILIALIVGWPLPLLASQIIWLNLITDAFFDMALATEGPEYDLMKAKPRGRRRTLLDRRLVGRLIYTGLLMSVLGLSYFRWHIDIDLDRARTLMLTTLAVIQWFNAWNARSEQRTIFELPPFGNRNLLIALTCAAVLQFAAVYWWPLQHILKTTPLSVHDWVSIIATSSLILLADIIWKKVWPNQP